MRDGHVWMRLLLLGGLLVTGCATLLIWTRRDRDRSLAKWLALGGLAAVMAYLGARLVPALKGPLAPPVGWFVEALCWALVATGEVLAWRSQGRSGSVS